MVSTIGIISLSSGIIGEDFVKHEVDLGGPTTQRPGDSILSFLPHSLKGLDFYQRTSRSSRGGFDSGIF